MSSTHRLGIRFLGTGAADWTSAHECSDTCRDRCAEIRERGGRNVRRFSSLFLAPDTIVDFTDHAERALDEYGIQGEALRHVIITHGHYDHFQPPAIFALASRLPHPLKLYGNQTVGHALDFAAHHSWDAETGRFTERGGAPDIEFEAVSPGRPFRVGDATATPVAANHMIDKPRMIAEQQALNYVFEREGKTLFYGLDSSFFLPETLAALGDHAFDVVVLDATFGDRDIDPEKSGHMNFALLREAVDELRRAELLRDGAVVVASHLSRCCVEPHDHIADRLAREGIALAYDGMCL